MNQGAAYAGDISAKEAWEVLVGNPRAQLVDVRTEAEWTYVGVPDLTRLGRPVLFCEWQQFPDLSLNSDFGDQVIGALETSGYRKGDPIYFICRSGARSRAAAMALTTAGYGPCFNIKEGFEGGLDAEAHRGSRVGWKAAGLPWVQS